MLTEKGIVNGTTGRIQGRFEDDWEGVVVTRRTTLAHDDDDDASRYPFTTL